MEQPRRTLPYAASEFIDTGCSHLSAAQRIGVGLHEHFRAGGRVLPGRGLHGTLAGMSVLHAPAYRWVVFYRKEGLG
jgi:hypothetical protein